MMAMRINVKAYQAGTEPAQDADGQTMIVDGRPLTRAVMLDPREVLVNLVLHPQRQLTGAEMYEAHKLAAKIEAAEGESLLLSVEDYQALRRAMEQVRGYVPAHRELVRRVWEAAETPVTPKE